MRAARLIFLSAFLAVAFLASSPVEAKKQEKAGSSENGGVYHPAAAVDKPQLILDTSLPTVPTTNASSPQQKSSPHADPAAARPLYPVPGIENMRVRSLFGQ
jgi:hypothetical protein